MRRRRQVSDIRFEALLGIATLLLIIGSISPWKSIASSASSYIVRINALNLWNGKTAFIGSMLALFATTVSYRIYQIDILQKFKPHTTATVGLIGSILALASSIAYIPSIGTGERVAWGIFVLIIGACLGILASLGLYREEYPRSPKGLG